MPCWAKSIPISKMIERMRAPEFWRHDGAMARLLSPASYLYETGSRLSRATTIPEKISVPVICIGNLVAGGAGKTPTALSVGAMLQRAGKQMHFLSRGYGGKSSGPLRVSTGEHGVSDVGDEALLLAAQAPTWIAHDRAAGARAAADAGADCIVMDDGFQNNSLAKDLSLIVVDADYGFGNGRLLPAGPLRERIEDGFGRADAVVLIEGALRPLDQDSSALPPLPAGVPVLKARLMPTVDGERLREQPVVAFAGIGRPAKFFETLLSLGAELIDGHAFADHHLYDEAEVMALVEAAHAANATLVTTAKDFVRLPTAARAMVTVLEVTLAFEAPESLAGMLAAVVPDG